MPANPEKKVDEFEFKAEMKQLLHLIVNSLYIHREIFLRELISNASDALHRARFLEVTGADILESEDELQISIELDPKEHRFSISDNGIGMTREDLIKRVGTVAASGTLEFIKKAQETGKPVDANLIGQFGVGLYSVFMVTDELTIETRHASRESRAYRWKSSGEGTFTIEEIDRVERGTCVSFVFKDDAVDFRTPYAIKNIIAKYSNFVDFPILVDGERVNTVTALWSKNKNEVTDEERNEFYKFISNDFRDPMGHIHVSIEGAINMKALLFIPAPRPLWGMSEEDLRAPQLYCNRVFVQENCKDLLPEHLQFVTGVVDTEDLPLNVSREVTQASPVMRKIRDVLSRRVIDLLNEWATNDPEKYDSFFRGYGMLIKRGIAKKCPSYDALVELLRFESTKTEPGKYTSLANYEENLKKDQEAIYYLAGEHREILEMSPNIEAFQDKDIEVLFFTDPIDTFMASAMEKYRDLPFRSVEQAGLDLEEGKDSKAEELPGDEAAALFARIKELLGDRIEKVTPSRRLVDSAVTLVSQADKPDPYTERMLRIMSPEYKPSKKILEINIAHPLIKNLSHLLKQGESDQLLSDCIFQLYEGAALALGELESVPHFVQRMTRLMERATSFSATSQDVPKGASQDEPQGQEKAADS